MLEILKNNIFVLAYAITWVFSILKLPKYFDSSLKYFPIIIGYTLFTEILGTIIFNVDDFTFFSEEKFSSYNWLIYNLYDLIFFLFFYFVYWKSEVNNRIKKIIKYGGTLYIVTLFINSLILDPFKYELWQSYIFGSLLLIFSIITYFYSLRLKSNRQELSTNLLAWTSIGLLIFHLGYLPITVFRNTHVDLTIQDFAFARKIHIGLILIMYGCFIIGFIKMKRFKPFKTI